MMADVLDKVSVPSPTDLQFIQRLREGDESAFMELVDRYQTAMIRVALIYVREREIAEDVVQETWIGVLRGLDQFQGRSTLKTWIFSILVNRARTRAQREGRYVTFSDAEIEEERSIPSVSPDRFQTADQPYPRHWAVPPSNWDEIPEDRLMSRETLRQIEAAIAQLSPHQREVITLRDIEGLSSEEVCNILALSETNQRVLLHRARSAVRRMLEKYLEE
jgi:RNA polymerase sigma-70 factor (ECF subfamily)